MLNSFIIWFKFISPEIWKGAFIGAIVSAIFAAAFSFAKIIFMKFKSQLPIRRILGEFADNDIPCSIFLKELYSKDTFYYSTGPDYFPPRTTNNVSKWQNVPYVISTSDVNAATDFTNLLGQVDKREKVIFRSIDKDWSLWSENLLSVGGNFKTDSILNFPKPTLIKFENNDSFRFTDSDQSFKAINDNDYGLIYKVKHPNTGKLCIVLMGIGVFGTEAAGYYLRTNASILGKMFGNRDFAFLLRVRIKQGKESATPCWYLPEPKKMKKIFHPLIWNRIFKPLKNNSSNKANKK